MNKLTCMYQSVMFTLGCVVSCSQVQAVTSVGGGDFSSPVTVSLRELSPDSNSGPPVTAIVVTVIVVIILFLAIIVATLVAYTYWSVPQLE